MELVKPTVTGYKILGKNIEDGYILMGIAIVMFLTVCYFVGTGM